MAIVGAWKVRRRFGAVWSPRCPIVGRERSGRFMGSKALGRGGRGDRSSLGESEEPLLSDVLSRTDVGR